MSEGGAREPEGRASRDGDAREGAERAPLAPGALLAHLRALGLQPVTARHAPVFTVEEARALRAELAESHPGPHTKNLFVKDKRGRFTLVTADEDARVDLRALGRLLGSAGRLSFASADALRARLGVEPGSVTPFALVNDPGADPEGNEGGRVRFVLDASLLRAERLNAHPLDNAMTTGLRVPEFLRFLAALGVTPTVVDFADPEAPALQPFQNATPSA